LRILRDIVKKLLNFRINTFCEKPFTGDIHQAEILFDIAEETKTKIYVDNIFLKRTELISLNMRKLNYKNIKFIWNKYDINNKENLIDSLLYHDLYILEFLFSDEKWTVRNIKVSEDQLFLSMNSTNKFVEFIYNRKSIKKEKLIYFDSECLDMTIPQNDPLDEIISEILNKKNIDYESNKLATIKTLNLIKRIKQHDN